LAKLKRYHVAPELNAGRPLDQLHRNAHASRGAPNTALHDVASVRAHRSERSEARPLNCKDEAPPITRRSRKRARLVMMSSVRPSAKYSSASALRSAIGSTASTGLGSSWAPLPTIVGWTTGGAAPCADCAAASISTRA